MRAFLGVICVSVVCATLAACGGGGSSDRQQISNMFQSTFAAVAHGDYAKACSYFSTREQANIVSNAKRVGLNTSTCAGTFTALIAKYHVSKAQLSQTFAAGHIGKVRSISVHGNNATITFTEATGGQTYIETDALVREGGQWKADHIIKRTASG